jgi:hypothetical protein
MLPSYRPDIQAWSFWTTKGWQGEFNSPTEALAARIRFVCKYCGGMFGVHLPDCYRPRIEK